MAGYYSAVWNSPFQTPAFIRIPFLPIMALALNGDAMDASLHRTVAFAAALLSTAVLAGEPDSRAEPIKLRLDPLFILEAVARRLNVPLQPEIALPKIHVASRTPLTQFQDALEEQWRIRPDAFVTGWNAHGIILAF